MTNAPTDATFAAAWDDALIEAVEGLEGEAWRRAATGVTWKPVYHLEKKLGNCPQVLGYPLDLPAEGACPGQVPRNDPP
jgi:hypothetical protein